MGSSPAHARAAPASGPASKSCVVCGRTIEWRKKWERNWNDVRYCGEKCRRNKLADVDRLLEVAIIDLLRTRASDSSICPSEAARRVKPEEWRQLMPDARNAARRLVGQGHVVITQGGAKVDPSTAKGPIRIVRGPDWQHGPETL